MNYEIIQIQNEKLLTELYEYREQIIKTQDFENAQTLASIINCLEICINELDKNTKLTSKRKREEKIHEIFKSTSNMKDKIITAFKNEFAFIADKFEIMDLLSNNRPMDYEAIMYLKLPTEEKNIVWHPGVYLFIGNSNLYRVGVSMTNSRARVMQHLDAHTNNGEHSIWDINNYEDKSIILINVKNAKDKFWLLAIESYFEMNFNPLIKAKRVG